MSVSPGLKERGVYATSLPFVNTYCFGDKPCAYLKGSGVNAALLPCRDWPITLCH